MDNPTHTPREGFDPIEVLKKVNTAIQHSNLKDTILHAEIRQVLKESKNPWNLSREIMPEFDDSYYVYGFMHHSCGNVTPFYKVAECKMNQWVKSDIGEQYTYWRKNLPAPEVKDQEQQFMESL